MSFKSRDPFPREQPHRISSTKHAEPPTNISQLEVDHFLNPTKLFKYISWEQWNEALLRIYETPQEAKTWIIAHHQNGKIRWRYLPLHLICRKRSSRQEVLVDALLSKYPEGARMKDNKGLLPEDHARNHCASEAVVDMLLQAYTQTSTYTNPNSCKAHNSSKEDRVAHAVRVNSVQDVKTMPKRLVSGSIECDDSELSKIAQPMQSYTSMAPSPMTNPSQNVTSHELIASQMVIMRLERELAKSKLEEEKIRNALDEANETQRDKCGFIGHLEQKLKDAASDNTALKNHIESLNKDKMNVKEQLDEKTKLVACLQKDVSKERAEQESMIVHLKSEVETVRAVSNALETKLHSKFSTETLLSTRVHELESSLENTAAASAAAVATFQRQQEALQSENEALQDSVKRLTEQNSLLQAKVKDLTGAVLGLVESLNSMSTDQERAMETAIQHEENLKQVYETERSELLLCIEKQKQVLQSTTEEQEALLSRASKRLDEVIAHGTEEREAIFDAILEQRKGLDSFASPGFDFRE